MAVGLIVMLSVVVISSSFYVPTENKSINQIQLKNTGSDIFAVLDYLNVLDTFNKAAIEGNISAILPFNANVSAVVKKFDASGALLDQIEINSDIQSDFISGKWIFVDGATNFYTVDYKVAFR